MVDLVPDLKLILGEPPPVPELPPLDAEHRFRQVLRRFIGVFARPEHPLALFLDDLQWLDAATLALLGDLATQPSGIAAAGRRLPRQRGGPDPSADPQPGGDPPGRRPGDRDRAVAAGARGRRAAGGGDAACAPLEATAPLADLVYEKTGGNPFFTIQFLTALAEEKLLAFSPGAGALGLGPRAHPRQGLHRQCRGPDGGQARPPAAGGAARPCNGWPRSAMRRTSPCSPWSSSDPPKRSTPPCGRPCGRAWCFGRTTPTPSCTTGFRRRPIR